MLSYTDIGHGTPILFIHGLGSRKEAWKPQHELADKYRLIIPDLRGHGETELDKNISMKNFARDIIELLEYLEIEETFVCGLSLGGLVAQELCHQRPDLVAGLILADTTTYIPYLPSLAIDRIKKVEEKDYDGLIEMVVRNSIHNKKFMDEAKEAFLIRDCYAESVKAPVGINYHYKLTRIKKPILFICGVHDKVTPLFMTTVMYMSTCNSCIKILDAGHLSNIERADDFNRSVEEFVSKNDWREVYEV